jgi:hypothetical protein
MFLTNLGHAGQEESAMRGYPHHERSPGIEKSLKCVNGVLPFFQLASAALPDSGRRRGPGRVDRHP